MACDPRTRPGASVVFSRSRGTGGAEKELDHFNDGGRSPTSSKHDARMVARYALDERSSLQNQSGTEPLANSVSRRSAFQEVNAESVSALYRLNVERIGLNVLQSSLKDKRRRPLRPGEGSDEQSGIYIKKVVPGSAAAMDGRLQSGDQLLSVNGHSLLSVTQEQAAKIMSRCGPIVSFEVAKEAALYNGLARWIYDQSPVLSQQNVAVNAGSRARLNSSDQVSTPSEYRYSLNSPLFEPKKSTASVSALSYTSSPSYYDQRSYSESMPTRQDQMAAAAVAAAAANRTYPVQETSAYSSLPSGRNVIGSERSFSTSNLMYDNKHHAKGAEMMPAASYQPVGSVAGTAPCASLPYQRSTYSLPRPAPPSGYDDRSYVAAQVGGGQFESQYYATSSSAGGFSTAAQTKVLDQEQTGCVRTETRSAGRSPQAPPPIGSLSDTDVSASYHRDYLHLQAQKNYRSHSVQQERNAINPPSYTPVKAASAVHAARLSDGDYSIKQSAVTGRSAAYSTMTTVTPSEFPLDKKMETSLVITDRPAQIPGESVAAPSSSDVGQMDFKSQIESEMEKLLKEELQRLESKSMLSEAERRRYMALKYELETRHNVSAHGGDHAPLKRSGPMPVSVPREPVNQGLDASDSCSSSSTPVTRINAVSYGQQDLDNVTNREPAVNYPSDGAATVGRGSSPSVRRPEGSAAAHGGFVPHGDSGRVVNAAVTVRTMPAVSNSEENDSLGRQILRDQYFETAERKYQELAARQWHAVHQVEADHHSAVKETPSGENGRNKPVRNAAEADRERTAVSPTEMIKEHVAVAPDTSAAESADVATAVSTSTDIAVEVAEDQTVRSSFYQSSFSETSTGGGESYRNHVKLSPVHESKVEQFTTTVVSGDGQVLAAERSTEPQPQYVYQSTEEEAPRAQVIGGQEIYKDPRQERLKSQKPFTNQIEGEKLSFKDKMRLFAKEIGESTPKERIRVSSAQRIIEQSLNV